MRTHTIQHGLRITSLALLVSAVLLLIAGWAWPLDAHAPREAVLPPASATAPKPANPLIPTSAIEHLAGMDLRRPLWDEAAAPTTMAMKLTGTMIDADQSVAMLAMSDGHTEFKRVGEEIAGVKILEIKSGAITVLFQGERCVLQVPPPEIAEAVAAPASPRPPGTPGGAGVRGAARRRGATP